MQTVLFGQILELGEMSLTDLWEKHCLMFYAVDYNTSWRDEYHWVTQSYMNVARDIMEEIHRREKAFETV